MATQVQLEELMTFKETMKYLRISRSTLWRWMQEGKIVGHKIGAGWRFYPSEVRALVVGTTEQGGREVRC